MTSVVAPKPAKRSLSLPNILTYSRIAAIPVVIGCMYAQSIMGAPLWLRWVALFVFIAAGITDFLDGYYARIWDQQSSHGKMLGPDRGQASGGVVPLGAGGGRNHSRLVALGGHRDPSAAKFWCRACANILPPSASAYRCRNWRSGKPRCNSWPIGFLIAGEAGEMILPPTVLIGIILLWISAILTIYTGWDYLRAGIHHLTEEDR